MIDGTRQQSFAFPDRACNLALGGDTLQTHDRHLKWPLDLPVVASTSSRCVSRYESLNRSVLR